jgi:plastocyanin
MPDLTDDLRALLADRAAADPAPPEMPAALPARIRRRRAVRTTAMLATPVLAAAAVVGVVALGEEPRRAVGPVAPGPSATASAPDLTGRYEFCDLDSPTPTLAVSAHPTEMKFAQGCYVVAHGFTTITFDNPHRFPHNVAVTTEGPNGADIEREPLAATEIVETGESTELTWQASPLAKGDYALFCQVHPLMYAQLVVR